MSALEVRLRITSPMLLQVHADLDRPHPFALERVGFMTCGVGKLSEGLILLGAQYHPVDDDHYEDDDEAGAMLGPAAFRTIMQAVYKKPACVVHLHRHEHRGRPGPSLLDQREMTRFMPDFFHVQPRHPHAAVILSQDSFWGRAWLPGQLPVEIEDFSVVGEQVSHWSFQG